MQPATKDINLADIIAPAFHDAHRAINRNTHRKFWFKGGRMSTKSSFVAIEIIFQIMDDPAANALVLRKVRETVRGSVLESLLWAIEKLGVAHLWDHTVSPAEIIYKPTGQKIILKGLDSPIKLKSIRVKKGYFKILWFEEVEEFNGMAEIRSVIQSVLRGGPIYLEFYTYNPPNDPQSWVNVESEIQSPNKYVHHSTYLDVPREWLGEESIKEAKELREINPLAYDHEYLGIAVGIHEAIIFSGKIRIATFEPQSHWHGPYFGLDWGFARDPMALVKCWIVEDGDRNSLYIENENFGINIQIDDTPDFIEEVDGSKKYIIRADSSRPEMISHVQRKGFSISAASKWKNSVEDGISVLKNFKEIVIHTRCTEMQKESRLYSYKIDKMTKTIGPDIIDKYNHGWDAVRYALDRFIKDRVTGFGENQVKKQMALKRTTIAPQEGNKEW
jgi:phage terminase large subunit